MKTITTVIHKHGENNVNQCATPPVVCTLAGIDPSGHAGLVADVRTISDLGAHPVTMVSALTLQNSTGWAGAFSPSQPDVLSQWACLNEDIPIAVLKVGLITEPKQFQQLQHIRTQHPALFIVQDPVAASSLAHAQNFKPQLLLGCDLLTPNLPELAQLTGLSVNTPVEIETAARACIALGAKSVLVKGGHSNANTHFVYDFFIDQNQSCWFQFARQHTANNRGTGCVLSSAIATFVGHGKALLDAIVLAQAYLQRGLSQGYGVGRGAGLVAHTSWPDDWRFFPQVFDAYPNKQNKTPFPQLQSLGLYPVVDSLAWLERLLKAGVKTVQLRVKNLSGEALTLCLKAAVTLGQHYQGQVIINDYWRQAIALGAWGVHLGQEDLLNADLEALAAAKIHLGISTHSEWEWCRALTYQPSYIAFGAVFPTQTKPVKVIGLTNLRRWQACLNGHIATTAIGGINLDNVDAVLACGIDSIALVSAICQTKDPELAVAQLQARLKPKNKANSIDHLSNKVLA